MKTDAFKHNIANGFVVFRRYNLEPSCGTTSPENRNRETILVLLADREGCATLNLDPRRLRFAVAVYHCGPRLVHGVLQYNAVWQLLGWQFGKVRRD